MGHDASQSSVTKILLQLLIVGYFDRALVNKLHASDAIRVRLAQDTFRRSLMFSPRPLVIAHRGASGYLPENTLAAKAVAHAQGADYWETDVLATRDGELVVLHDLYLESLSDVRAKFSDRARSDGHFYVIDFTLAELRTLNLTERLAGDLSANVALYPSRFPPGKSRFVIHTLAQEIELLQGLNKSFKRDMGLYVELKAPWFHEDAGFDLCQAALELLKRYGYTQQSDAVIVETFDAKALEHIKQALMPRLQMDLRLTQLVGLDAWQATCQRDASGNWVTVASDWMLTSAGLEKISRYASAIAVAIELLWVDDKQGGVQPAPWIGQAHALGLGVHAYTLRADDLPAFACDVDVMHDWLIHKARVDAVFTDFPDLMVRYLDQA